MARGQTGQISNTVAFSDSSAVNLDFLPPNAFVIDVKVAVLTAFDAGTTNQIDVGTSADPDHYANNVDVSSSGDASVTLLNGGEISSTSEPTQLTATYAQTGTAATAGSARVIVTYGYND